MEGGRLHLRGARNHCGWPHTGSEDQHRQKRLGSIGIVAVSLFSFPDLGLSFCWLFPQNWWVSFWFPFKTCGTPPTLAGPGNPFPKLRRAGEVGAQHPAARSGTDGLHRCERRVLPGAGRDLRAHVESSADLPGPQELRCGRPAALSKRDQDLLSQHLHQRHCNGGSEANSCQLFPFFSAGIPL